MKKAIILDLDNTIFPMPSIGDTLFAPLFNLIKEKGEYQDVLPGIREDVMSIPFQKVADKYKLDDELKKEAIRLLSQLTYDGKILPYPDYSIVRSLPVRRFIVTMGFAKMQWSKIKQLGIEEDFEKVIVLDPQHTVKIKKDAFQDIMTEFGYQPGELLVIGDDPLSEIRGAAELGIETVLYNHEGKPTIPGADHTITNYQQLKEIFQW